MHIDKYDISYFTRQDPHKQNNEDNLMIFPLHDHGVILAVADGVGSARHAAKASNKLLSEIVESIRSCPNTSCLREVRNHILDGIEKINTKLSSMSGYLTTVTVACLVEDKIQIFQIGDSGLVICGQRGKLKYKTMAHSPVGYALESGIISAEEALVHPENHIVDNVVGDQVFNVELSSVIHLASYDTILLATDGLLDNYLIEDMINFIRKGNLETIAKQLTNDILGQYNTLQNSAFLKADDTSFILCRAK